MKQESTLHNHTTISMFLRLMYSSFNETYILKKALLLPHQSTEYKTESNISLDFCGQLYLWNFNLLPWSSWKRFKRFKGQTERKRKGSELGVVFFALIKLQPFCSPSLGAGNVIFLTTCVSFESAVTTTGASKSTFSISSNCVSRKYKNNVNFYTLINPLYICIAFLNDITSRHFK